MTGAEMITSFLQYYDRITNFTAKGYETDEILLFLNNAQDEFIKDRVFGMNFQPPAFDDNEKRVADIRPLVEFFVMATSVSAVYGNSVVVNPYDTDSSFMYCMKLDVRVTRTNPVITQEYLPAKNIRLEDAGNFKNSVFNRLWFKNPVYFGARDSGIFIIGDYYTTTMDSVRINYVRRPITITAATTEFDGTYGIGIMSLEPHVHQEIVDMAVNAARGAGREQKSQIEVVEEKSRTK